MKKIMMLIGILLVILIALAWVPYYGYQIDGSNGGVDFTNIASIDADTIDGESITDGVATLTGGALSGVTSLANETVVATNYIKARSAYYEFINLGTVSGTADSIYLDYTVDFDSLQTGLTVWFIADSAVTGASTLTVDALAEKAIFENHDVSATDANDIRAGMIVGCMYDGTQWVQFTQGGN